MIPKYITKCINGPMVNSINNNNTSNNINIIHQIANEVNSSNQNSLSSSPSYIEIFRINKEDNDEINYSNKIQKISSSPSYLEILKLNKDDKDDIIYKEEYKNLSKAKCLIDTLSNTIKWDKAKIVINPYELVYISKFKNGVTNFNPVSRSFFKMWELLNRFNIFNDNNGINIACLAEGPGGFVEAMINYRMMKNNGYCLDNINGITLKKGKAPLWDPLIKKFGHKNINLRLGYGDLYNAKSIRSFCKNINGNMHIVTADGGFNYSSDYNNQEKQSYRIIFNEVLTALTLQKKGGLFICKMFDIFQRFTVELLYILYCLYDEIHIVKLQTSRVANSEKYLVAKGFNIIGPALLENLYNISENWNDNIIGFSGINVPKDFINELGEINKKYVNEQINSIKKTIDFAKRTDIFYPFKNDVNDIQQRDNNNDYDKNNNFNKKYWNNNFKNKKRKAKNKFNKNLFNKEHIKKAIQWCIDYDMPINKDSIYLDNINTITKKDNK